MKLTPQQVIHIGQIIMDRIGDNMKSFDIALEIARFLAGESK